MKNNLRNIHINGECWKYSIKSNDEFKVVRIFNSDKKLFFKITAGNLLKLKTFYDSPKLQIKLSDIKTYILESI